MDLVVARYNEDVDWIDQLNFDRIFVYNKGHSLNNLKKNVIFQQLKNWGHESDTYLTHILNHYNDLSDVTIFVQGHPFDHCPDIMHFLSLKSIHQIINDYVIMCRPSISNYFDEDLVALGHCWELNVLDDWDKYLWLPSMMRVIEITSGKRFIPLGHKAVWGAQFAISRKAIQKYSYNQYKQIKAISDENYYLPWGMEKYWLYLLGNTKSTFEVKYFF